MENSIKELWDKFTYKKTELEGNHFYVEYNNHVLYLEYSKLWIVKVIVSRHPDKNYWTWFLVDEILINKFLSNPDIVFNNTENYINWLKQKYTQYPLNLLKKIEDKK